MLMGLYVLLMSRDRFTREAERDARRLSNVFPWMNVEAEVKTQLLLRRIVPPVFIVLGVLTLFGVVGPTSE